MDGEAQTSGGAFAGAKRRPRSAVPEVRGGAAGTVGGRGSTDPSNVSDEPARGKGREGPGEKPFPQSTATVQVGAGMAAVVVSTCTTSEAPPVDPLGIGGISYERAPAQTRRSTRAKERFRVFGPRIVGILLR